MSSITAYIPNHAIYTIAGVLAAHFPKCTPERVEKMLQQEFEKDTYLRLFDDDKSEEQQKPQIEQPKPKQSDDEIDNTPDMFAPPMPTNVKAVYNRPNSHRKRCVIVETNDGFQRFSFATELFKHFNIQNSEGTHAFPRYILREATNEAECVKAEARYLNEHIQGGIKQYIRYGIDGKQHVYKFKGASAYE